MARPPKTYVFIHQNMPGQFLHLIEALARGGDAVYFVSNKVNRRLKGVTSLVYSLKPDPEAGPDESSSARLLRPVERDVRHAQGAAAALRELRKRGTKPDLIVGHTGWGEMLFVGEVFPGVPVLGYFEYFYRPHGADVNFDPEFPGSSGLSAQLRLRNFVNLSSLELCDRGVTPTVWQQSTYPELYRPKLTVLHEGVDTAALRRPADATLTLPDGRRLGREDEVVTYVARNLEPYRGFHVAMRAFAEVGRRRPNAHVVIVGGDGASYGRKLAPGEYRRRALAEVEIDPGRVHFLGKVPYAQFLTVLHVSCAHLYLTYPFILSWSMLEAMAAECLVIGSRTGPVEEVLVDGRNGVLVDFFDHHAIADRIVAALETPRAFDPLRAEARRTVMERYDLHGVTLPRYTALLRDMVG